jgi:integrase
MPIGIATARTPASDYLDLFRDSTRLAYMHALKRFFKHTTGIKPDGLDASAAAYLHEVSIGSRSPADDLVHVIAKLQREYAPATVGVTRAAMIGFFEENHIELSRLDERRIKKRVPRRITVADEQIITRDHLRSLLPILSPRDKAVVLVLLSSGGRIGEVLQLRLSDIDLDVQPARIVFRQGTTKNGQQRISFLTSEAVVAVRGWLLVRDAYLRAALKRNHGLVGTGRAKNKDPHDPRLFPFQRTSFDHAWWSALERTGLDKKCETTGRHVIHPHGLRKCFRSWLGASAGPDLPEILMGHEGYLSTYRRYTEDELRDAYSQHNHVLCIVGGSEDLARQLAAQQNALDVVKDENEVLRQELTRMKADLIEVQAVRALLTNLGVLSEKG